MVFSYGSRNGAKLGPILWITFFCYTTVAALLFQKLLLPLIPSLHAGSGLMQNDSSYFHSQSVLLAAEIKNYGLINTILFCYQKLSGNIIVTGGLYSIFGVDPLLVIPVNAILHATSGLLIYLIGQEIWRGKTGQYGGISAAILFVVFPSSINWYGQLHKDGYFIAGILLIIYSWVTITTNKICLRSTLKFYIGSISGMLLIMFVRPYYIKVLTLSSFIVLVTLLVCMLISSRRDKLKLLGLFASICLLFVINISRLNHIYSPKQTQQTPNPRLEELTSVNKSLDGNVYSALDFKTLNVDTKLNEWSWRPTPVIPAYLDQQLETLTKTRVGMMIHNIREGAGSAIDNDVAPADFAGLLRYTPRSLQIGLLAPFPSTWFDKVTLMRLVSLAEMAIWYVLLPGVFITLWHKRTVPVLILVVFGCFMLAFHAYLSPNLGTLYRQRYVYLMLMLLLGSMGWAHFITSRFINRNPDNGINPAEPELQPVEHSTGDGEPTSRKAVVGAGSIVMFLTFLSYLGFFFRDLLMARTFGIGSDLDTFYIGMMLPMFLVTVVSMPMGQAIVPSFLDFKSKHSREELSEFLANIVFLTTMLLGVAALILYIAFPTLVSLTTANFAGGLSGDVRLIMLLFLPVLILSGSLIIGNAVINSLGQYSIPGFAQLIVPITAITGIVLFGRSTGVYSVAVSMIIGQVLNLAIIMYAMKRLGVSMTIRLPRSYQAIGPLFGQYWPLVLTAALTSSALLVDNAFASTLVHGSVAALNMGTKMVIFVSGMIGTCLTSVLLPHFSSFMARNHFIRARSELAFFLSLFTLILIPMSVFFFIMSENIVGLLLSGGAIKSGDIQTIAKVMRFGVIQIPFFAAMMLLMRFSTAQGRSQITTAIAAISLTFNIVLDYLLIKYLNVSGIALSSSLSLAISCVLLVLFIYKSDDLSGFDTLFLLLGWMLYMTIMLCLYCNSFVGVAVVSIAYLLLTLGQIRSILNEHRLQSQISA